jgi:EAL domain-containing protein (putative c-di-GMP-specific phosphodiesterase class I)
LETCSGEAEKWGETMMDPLDILTHLDQVVPYYQPIFSADEQCIIGYEVLGRFQTADGIVSLGSFFHDETIPEEFRMEVDQTVTMKAFDQFLYAQDPSSLIFINRDANLLMLDRGEAFLQMLLRYKEKGLKLERIVLEITEHNFKGDIQQLGHVLTYFRTYGIKIAVDNIGKESSNLDRIRLLSPDILKIDLQALRTTSVSLSYHDVLYSISLLARKIGATLLYEDIESSFQLQYAWRNGGRYYQGYYLSEPSDQFLPSDFLKERLRQEFHQFIQHEKKKLQTLYDISEQFQLKIGELLAKHKKIQDFNELISLLAKELSDCCFRIYICDEDGFQRSANIFKKDEGWELQPQYYMKNWSWRPYFLENIIRMRSRKRGILSDLYSDIETGETIRTYSYPIDEHHYLFIDLSYAYLFEHNAHLS